MSNGDLFALTIPKWGMAMTTGTVLDWLVVEGDKIEKGDEVLEVESDKIAGVVESNNAGFLVLVVAAPGDELPVGALLGVIAKGDVNPDLVDAFVDHFHKNFTPEAPGASDDVAALEVFVGGTRIAYQHSPAPDNNNFLPILFVHGFGGDQNSWLFNTVELSSNRAVYALDLPGHGSSAKTIDDGTLKELAGIVSAFIIAIGVPKMHLVGHSLGAAISLELCKLTPGQVASLTLLGSAGEGTLVNRAYIEGFVSAKRRKEIKPLLQQLFSTPELVNRDMVEGVLRAKRIEGAENCLRSIAEASLLGPVSIPTYESLGSVNTPIQIIWGREDKIADVSQTDKLVGRLDVHIIENAGHMVHMEAAATVNGLIAAFIAVRE